MREIDRDIKRQRGAHVVWEVLQGVDGFEGWLGMPRSYRPDTSGRSHVIGLRVRGGGALLQRRWGILLPRDDDDPPPPAPAPLPSRPRVADLLGCTWSCDDELTAPPPRPLWWLLLLLLLLPLPPFKLIFCTLRFSDTHSGWMVKYCLRGDLMLLKNGESVPGRRLSDELDRSLLLLLPPPPDEADAEEAGPPFFLLWLFLSMLTRMLLLLGSPSDIRDVGNGCRGRLKQTNKQSTLVTIQTNKTH